MSDRLDEIKMRLEAAAPGPYDARVLALDNHALSEVWTEAGWYQQLPKSYREPTTEMFAHAPADLAWLIAEVRRLEEERDDWRIAYEGDDSAFKLMLKERDRLTKRVAELETANRRLSVMVEQEFGREDSVSSLIIVRDRLHAENLKLREALENIRCEFALAPKPDAAFMADQAVKALEQA